MWLRLLPLILSALLFAAHVMRDAGLLWALPILLPLLLLLIRTRWVLRLWQGLLLLFTLEWVRTTVELALFRYQSGQPYLRMLLILLAVIALNLWAVWLLQINHRATERTEEQ